MKPHEYPDVTSVIYALTMVYAVFLGLFDPLYNWDMLCYVASVTAWTEHGADRIFGDTMAIIKDSIPNWVYSQHSTNALSVEARSFVQVLPVCEVKPLYNAAVWLVHTLSPLSLARATWTASSLFFGFLAVQLYRWRLRNMVRPAWLAMVLILCFVGDLPMASLARWSTPDCLSTLLAISGLYQAICWKRFGRAAVLGWLAVLARPDAVLLAGCMTLYFSVRPRPTQKSILSGLLFLAVLGATTFFVDRAASGYGWEKLFVYSFLFRTPTPADYLPTLDIPTYLRVLTSNGRIFFTSGIFLVLAGLSTVALALHRIRPHDRAGSYFELLVMFWVALLGRFLVWPAWGEDRYYYSYFIMIPLLGGEVIAPHLRPLKRMIETYRHQPEP